jgi:hypothetical protein
MQDVRQWKIKKQCITQGVILGLLKQAHSGAAGGIIKIPEEQPYSDGTVFLVHNIQAFLQVFNQVRSYATHSLKTDTHTYIVHDIRTFLHVFNQVRSQTTFQSCRDGSGSFCSSRRT